MPVMPTCFITDLITKTPHRYCRNRLYWIPDTPPTSATNMVTLANTVFANYSTIMAALMPNTCSFYSVYCRYTDPALLLDGYSTTAGVGGTGGTLADTELPDEVCMEIQRRTGLSGRQNRGRLFFSGISSAYNNAGELSAAGRTALVALAAKIGPDQTFAPLGLCHARHYDRKDNQLKGVMQARATNVFVSRRDRRKPMMLMPI